MSKKRLTPFGVEMESIAELREKLQAPRREVDTWYGRYVMRFFSIYITRFFIGMKWSPNRVTLLSLAAAILGGFFFSMKAFGLGIVFLNLWYLIDHVDGEVARYTKQSSPTGFFFDTVVNFIVLPWTFFTLGAGIESLSYRLSLAMGILGAFSSLMLMILPLCEDAVMLNLMKKGVRAPAAKEEVMPPAIDHSGSLLRRIFSYWHQTILFPNYLLFMTAAYLLLPLAGVPRNILLQLFLVYYSLSVTAIWILQLINKVKSKKLDHALVQAL